MLRRVAQLAGLGLLACSASLPLPAREAVTPAVDSPAGLLASLPPAYRDRYALVFESRSTQPASLEAPRIVAFGDDATTVFTFSAASEVVESLRFDAESESFELRELTFATVGGVKVTRSSEADPPRCLTCHGSPPRPIWDTYPAWPGAYGETVHGAPSALESSGWARFSSSRAADPLYGQLVVSTHARSAALDYEGSRSRGANAELSRLLAGLQARAIARSLRDRPGYGAARYALATASLPRCDLGAALPDALSTKLDGPIAALQRDTAEANARQALRKRARLHAAPEDFTPRPLGEVRAVAELLVGVDTSAWSTALEAGTYDFASGERSSLDVSRVLLADLARTDGRLRALVAPGPPSRELCRELEARSRAALRGVTPVHASKHASPLLSQCVTCHANGIGPTLAFDRASLDARAFAHGSLREEIAWRLDPASGLAHMPPTANPSDAERAALLAQLAR